jgi:sugar transferase (PEP-CTERM/EpsH1 system associated)
MALRDGLGVVKSEDAEKDLMRILFLTSRLPFPPDRGDRLRVFNFIRTLSKEHEIHLFSFIAREEERKHIAGLQEYCRQVEVVLMTPLRSALTVALNIWRKLPLQALYYRSRGMSKLLSDTVRTAQFDAVYIHLFRMAPYAGKEISGYRILDMTDVISREIELSLPSRSFLNRLLYSFEVARIKRYEQVAASLFDETWVISEAEKECIESVGSESNFVVVGNGVDLEGYALRDYKGSTNQLIFVGHMGVRHNTDAAEYLVKRILPEVRRSIPDCSLNIVGSDPSPDVLALGNCKGVTVSGYVEDLNDALRAADIFVAPLRFCTGVQNKVLEAMAVALPVVATPAVNSGLRAEPGREILIGQESTEIAAQIVELLGDSAKRESIGTAGRNFVETRFSWASVVEVVRRIESEKRNIDL